MDRNKVVLLKMKAYSEKIINYTNNMCFDDFINDTKTLEACVFNLSQIGELVKLVDKEITNKYSNINWIAIKNLRNRIVHDYDGIQFKIIWLIISKNIPDLIENIDLIIKNDWSE